jgi:UDP-2,3-diacylglucosamine pyrophosphatase LpxH
MNGSNTYRSIWLSDFHLGTRDCKADYLLDFLRHNESEYLYLVGDIFDGWALRKSWYWHQNHNDVVQKLLRKARKGTHIVYIPGNHDEFARNFFHLMLGEIRLEPNVVHITADGRRFLVLHGDEFDGLIGHARWLSLLGSHAYDFCLKLNRIVNTVRRRLNSPYWSLSAYLKNRTKKAVQFIANFEHAVVLEAKKWEVDGVVCGHIHHAEQRVIDGILYANTGDWVESCTALVEHSDGRLEIVNWASDGHFYGMKDVFAQGDGHLLESEIHEQVVVPTIDWTTRP